MFLVVQIYLGLWPKLSLLSVNQGPTLPPNMPFREGCIAFYQVHESLFLSEKRDKKSECAFYILIIKLYFYFFLTNEILSV